MKNRRWEDLCNQCGMCCYDRYPDSKGRLVVDLTSPCEYLDQDSQKCTVYAERFKVCGDCRRLTIFHALFSRYLPESCGYVQAYRFWKRKKASLPLPQNIREDSSQ